jgi:hypothetical protein
VVETVTELVVRVADLVEAEGRQLRHIAVRVGIALAAILVGGLLAIGAFVMMLIGVYIWLEGPLGEGGAAFVTGLITLLVAGGAVWGAMKLTK